MVQLTCIYTRSGDKGKTSLGDGKRILKSSLRIVAIGEVDEANSHLGCALSLLQEADGFAQELKQIQNDLFNVGADLCIPSSGDSPKLTLKPTRISELEQDIDRMNQDLSPLKSFVLPGGGILSSTLFLTRAVVRRTERAVVALSDQEYVAPHILQYLNRLSDYLFVAGRWDNQREGRSEVLWVPGS